MGSKTFEDLIVWQKAHQWIIAVYKMTDTFPSREQFGLTSQMRRAAVSVAANIAEGFKKKGKLDKSRFYNMAQGSLEESRYYLILVRDLGYADTAMILGQLEEVSRLLESYLQVMNRT